MVLLGSPQAPPGAMRPVPGVSWRLRATECAASELLGGGGGGGGGGAEGGGDGAEGELEAEAEGNLGDLNLEGELVLVDAACHTPGYWHLATPAAAAQVAQAAQAAQAREPPRYNGAPAGGGVLVAAVAGDEWHTGDVFGQLRGGWLVHRCRRDELLLHSSGEMTNPVALEAPYSPPTLGPSPPPTLSRSCPQPLAPTARLPPLAPARPNPSPSPPHAVWPFMLPAPVSLDARPRRQTHILVRPWSSLPSPRVAPASPPPAASSAPIGRAPQW